MYLENDGKIISWNVNKYFRIPFPQMAAYIPLLEQMRDNEEQKDKRER